MADIHDMTHAEQLAEAAHEHLQTYCGQVEEGAREPELVLALGLATVALGASLRAAAVRIDYRLGQINASR